MHNPKGWILIVIGVAFLLKISLFPLILIGIGAMMLFGKGACMFNFDKSDGERRKPKRRSVYYSGNEDVEQNVHGIKVASRENYV